MDKKSATPQRTGVEHFNYLCSLLPEGFYWSDPLTPDVLNHIVLAAAPAQSAEARGTLAGYFLNCAADDVKPHYLPVGEEHKDNEDVVALYFAPHASGCGDGEDCDACNAMNGLSQPTQPAKAGERQVITVWRDASWKQWSERDATCARDDGDWLAEIPLATQSAVVLDDERAAKGRESECGQ